MSFIATIKSLFGFGSKGPGAMGPGDRLLDCEDCKSQFVFDAGEQTFFKEKGFSDPKRCPKCRKKVRSRMRRRRGRGGGGGGGEGGEAVEARKDNHHSNGNGNNQHEGGRGRGGRGRGRRRSHSVIDGDSPYADER